MFALSAHIRTSTPTPFGSTVSSRGLTVDLDHRGVGVASRRGRIEAGAVRVGGDVDADRMCAVRAAVEQHRRGRRWRSRRVGCVVAGALERPSARQRRKQLGQTRRCARHSDLQLIRQAARDRLTGVRVAAGRKRDRSGADRGDGDDAEHRHRDVTAVAMPGVGREVLLEASPAVRGRGIDARRAAVERVAQRSFEFMGPAHGSITSRSWESARWSSDLTVPGRHPSATAISASDKSS